MRNTSANTITTLRLSATEWGKPRSLCGTIRETKTNPIYTHSVHAGDLADQKGGATQLDGRIVRHQLLGRKTESRQKTEEIKERERETREDKKLKVHFLCVAWKKSTMLCGKRIFKPRRAISQRNRRTASKIY